MNIISNQYLREEKKGSAVYTIEIRNFLRKLSQCRVGSKVSTEMFYVNLSKFSIDLYIAGDRAEDHLSIFLTHHSDWMVRARADVSVKHEVQCSTVKAGTVFQPQTMRLAERSLGWSKCVPHCRCTTGDLIRLIEVKVVEIMADNGTDNGPLRKELEEMQQSLLLQEKISVGLRNDLNKLTSMKQKLHWPTIEWEFFTTESTALVKLSSLSPLLRYASHTNIFLSAFHLFALKITEDLYVKAHRDQAYSVMMNLEANMDQLLQSHGVPTDSVYLREITTCFSEVTKAPSDITEEMGLPLQQTLGTVQHSDQHLHTRGKVFLLQNLIIRTSDHYLGGDSSMNIRSLAGINSTIFPP